MEIIAIPPTTPPAMAPAWPPDFEDVGDAVEDALAEAEDVNTPEAPKTAPGPYSGWAI